MRLRILKGNILIVPDRALVRAAVAVGGAVETLSLLRPIIFMVLIDRLITSASFDTISILVMVLAVIASMDSWLSYKKSIRLAEASALTFGGAVFTFWEKYQGTCRTDGHEAGPSDIAELIPRLYSAAAARCTLKYTLIVDLPASILIIIVLGSLNIWMTLIMLVAVPFVLFNELRSRNARERINAELVSSSSRLRQRVDEMIAGQPILAQIGMSSFASSYIWGSLSAAAGSSVNQQRYQAQTVRISGWIQTLAALLILLVGSGIVSSGFMSVGALIAFDMLAGQLRTKVTTIMQVYTTAMDQDATFDRVDRVLKDRRIQTIDWQPSSSNLLRCVDLSFYYVETQTVISQLNYDFEGGKVYAITGPSGSGKSTLGKMLAGQLVGGGGISYELQRKYQIPVVYLPQDAWLFGGSIYENILLKAPKSPLDETEIARAHASAIAAGIRNLGVLESNPGEFGRRLSGGQKQRVHLARMFAQSAAVFVADEPSSALDGPLKTSVGQSLREKARDGAIVILITHDEELIGVADVVLALSEGKLERLYDVLDKSDQRSRSAGNFDTASAFGYSGHSSSESISTR
jgi:ABC-type bacteriocin/lantibiotic exporter with double-glycine peptidase domain